MNESQMKAYREAERAWLDSVGSPLASEASSFRRGFEAAISALAQQAGAVPVDRVRAFAVGFREAGEHRKNMLRNGGDRYDDGCADTYAECADDLDMLAHSYTVIASSAPGGGGEVHPFVTCRCHDERAKELCLDKHRCVRVSAHALSPKEQV